MSVVNSSYDFIGDWFCIFYATRLASKTGGHFSIQSELKPEPICDLLAQMFPHFASATSILSEIGVVYWIVWMSPLFGYSDNLHLGFGFMTLIKQL